MKNLRSKLRNATVPAVALIAGALTTGPVFAQQNRVQQRQTTAWCPTLNRYIPIGQTCPTRATRQMSGSDRRAMENERAQMSSSASSGSGYGAGVSSYGHSANSIHPVRVGGTPVVDRRTQPGEDCPPGSRCAHPLSSGGGSGSGSGASAYGARESYGSAAMDSRHQASAQPIRAGGYGRQSVTSPANIPVPNAPSRETGSMGYVNSYTHEQSTTASNLNPGSRDSGVHNGMGQKGPTSITTDQQMVGHNVVGGQTLVTQQPTSVAGPDGKRTQLGYQKPTSREMGSLGKASGGGAPGVNGHTKNLQNGGVDAASQGNAQDFNSTHTYDPATGKWTPNQDAFHKAAPGALDQLKKGADQLFGLGGGDSSPDKKKGKKDSDPRMNYGHGSAVSATSGKLIKPGKGGSDVGGGGGNTGPQGDPSITNANGRASATLTGEAVDVNRKPQEKGQLKANYNGTGGAIDPKKGGH